MALINCPDCGAEVSDAAPACPKCGRPIASPGPSAYAKDRGGRTRSPATFTITLSSFVLIVLAIAAAVWFVPSLEIGQNLEGTCHVNGTGQGTCQFTNTGWTPGSQCVDVALRNKQDGSMVRSGPVCSGRVWPNDTAEKSITIAIGNTCDSALGVPDLSDVCTMDVNNVDSIDASAGPLSTEGAAPPSGQADDAVPAAASAPAPGAAAPDEAASSPTPSSSVAMSPAATSTEAPAPSASVANASGPSFDCSKVTDATDLTICSNTELSQLDQQMAVLYFARAQSGADPTARDEQRTWLHDRNQCGADVICLRKEYAARIQQLQQ